MEGVETARNNKGYLRNILEYFLKNMFKFNLILRKIVILHAWNLIKKPVSTKDFLMNSESCINSLRDMRRQPKRPSSFASEI